MMETIYLYCAQMMEPNEQFNVREKALGTMFMALLITILILILILYIGKLLWNCCLATNVAGVKPLKSWVDLLGIYILIRILICK
jgi:hypothetical protein